MIAKSPCKGCQNRSATCRGPCAKWTAYEIVLVKDRKIREELRQKKDVDRVKHVKTRHYIPGNEGSKHG